jgi:hypothetical protein
MHVVNMNNTMMYLICIHYVKEMMMQPMVQCHHEGATHICDDTMYE